MKNKNYLILGMVLCFIYSCDPLEPENDNTYDLDDVKSVVTFAEGILLNAYNVPSYNSFPLSYASDDAVVNDPNHPVKDVVSGGWDSNDNPFSTWNSAYESILYVNTFLQELDGIVWDPRNEATSQAYAEKLKGEAYALRAWHYFSLLQAHAGIGENGQKLGVPIVDRVLTTNPEDYEIPRSTFNELVEFIVADCDRAIALLPNRWVDTGNSELDAAIGAKNTNRINGLVAHLIKTKTLLYAASPAYSDGTYTYQMAAEAAAKLMDENGGLSGYNSTSIKFYNNGNVTGSLNTDKEVIWYSSRQNNQNSWELNNYPPSQFGRGRTNPTQDLVNAFPMLDGTPTPSSKINSSDPYSGRDPRLNEYILYNGATFERGGQTVIINTTAGSQDALGSADILATETGYYLKKFMNVTQVDLDPTLNSTGFRYYVYARYTDALLMFAEAANEYAGPDANVGGYTAREIINAIRSRAGITSTEYVDGLGQAAMRDLIRNERRLEMSFEGQRFWDLRRWNMLPTIKQPVSGVEVSADGTTYTYLTVENRNFADYQIYGPIPFAETLKYDLIQNMGWQ